MTDEWAFLHAIAVDPANPAPRLMYADWLDEQGRPNSAERLRLEVELAQEPPHMPRPGLRRRANSIRHDESDLLTLPSEWSIDFDQGLPSGITLSSSACLRDPSSILTRYPWHWITLRMRSSDAALLAEQPPWQAALGLRLVSEIGDAEAMFTTLLRSRHLMGLKRLALDRPPLQGNIPLVLRGNSALNGLRSLVLDTAAIDQRSAEHLALSPHLAGLEELTTIIDGSALQVLLRGRALLAPRSLELVVAHWNDERDLGYVLADAERLASLRRLMIRSNATMTNSGFEAFVRAPQFANLESLSLVVYAMGDEMAAQLGKQRTLTNLQRLDLRRQRISAQGAERLARAHLPSLRVLWLTGNPLLPSGLYALAEAVFLQQLSHLDLSGCRLRGGLDCLASDADMPELRSLGLAENDLTDADLRALAPAPWLGRLHTLDLSINDFTQAGLREFLSAADLGHLRDLLLGSARVQAAELRTTLRDSPLHDECWVQLTEALAPHLVRVGDLR